MAHGLPIEILRQAAAAIADAAALLTDAAGDDTSGLDTSIEQLQHAHDTTQTVLATLSHVAGVVDSYLTTVLGFAGVAGTEAGVEGETGRGAEADGSSYTARDIATVERHLTRLDHAPQNDAMLDRIRQALSNGAPLGEAEHNFMRHETTEAALMDQGMTYEDAHEIALRTHPLFKNYAPDVIEQFPELFNSNWRRAWGLT